MDHQKIFDDIKNCNWKKATTSIKKYYSTFKRNDDGGETFRNFTRSLLCKVEETIAKHETESQMEISEITDMVNAALLCQEYSLDSRKRCSSPNYDAYITYWLYGIFKFFIKQENKDYKQIVKTFNQLNEELLLGSQTERSAEEQKNLNSWLKNCSFYLWNAVPKDSERMKTDEKANLLTLELREKSIGCIALHSEDYTTFYKWALITATCCYNNLGKNSCQVLEPFYRRSLKLAEKLLLAEKDPVCVGEALTFIEGWITQVLFSNANSKLDVMSEINQLRSIIKFDNKSKSDLESSWNFYMDIACLMALMQSFHELKCISRKQIDSLLRNCTKFLQMKSLKERCITIHPLLLFIKSVKRFCQLETSSKSYAVVKESVDVVIRLLIEFINSGVAASKSPEFLTCLTAMMKFYALHLKSNCQKEKDLILPSLLAVIELYNQFVGNLGLLFDVKTYVTLAWNSITILYKGGYFEDVCALLDHCTDHFVKFITETDASFLTALENKIQMIVYSFCKCHHFSKALHYLAKLMAVGYANMDFLFHQWLIIKRYARDFRDFRKITVEICSSYIKSDAKMDMEFLLNKEVDTYKEYNSLNSTKEFSIEIFAALKKLHLYSRSSIDKASTLIRMAKQLVNSSMLPGDPSELLAEALQLLQPIKLFGENTMIVDGYLAEIHFCQYVIKNDRLQKLSASKVDEALKKQAEKAKERKSREYRQLEKPIFSEIISSYEHITYNFDLEDVNDLDLMLKFWSSAIPGKIHAIPNKLEGLEDLVTAAETYSLKRMTNKEFEAWIMALQLSKELKNWPKFIYISCRIIRILLHCGITTRAAVFLANIKKHVNLDDNSSELRTHKVFILLCESELLLLQNKVIDGWKILKKAAIALEEPELEKLSLTYVLKCELNFLQSKFCELPLALLPISERNQMTSIDVSRKGFTMAISVARYEKGPYKPLIINCMFNTALHLGRLFLDIGAPREARCCLRAMLVWAHQFALGAWTAELLSLLAKIMASCGDFKSCQTFITAITYILNSDGTRLLTSETAVVPLANEENDDKHDLSDDFVFFSINDLNTAMCEDTDEDLRASPILRKDYNPLEHLHTCDCNKCKNLLFHHLCLKHWFLQAECYSLQPDHISSACNILKDKIMEMNSLYEVEETFALDIYKRSYFEESVPRGNKLKSCFKELHIHHLLQLVKYEMSCKLSAIYLSEKRYEEAQVVIKDAYNEAKQISYLGVQHIHVIVASLIYLYCVNKIILRARKDGQNPMELFNGTWALTSIPIAHVEFDEDIRFLEAKTPQIKLTDDVVRNLKTPKPNRRAFIDCNAPAKRKPRVSAFSNNFDKYDDLDCEADVKVQLHEKMDQGNEENIDIGKIVSQPKPTNDLKRIKHTNSKVKFSNNVILKEADKNVRFSKISSNIIGFTGAKYIPLLENALSSISHNPPYPLYRDLNVLLALCKGQHPHAKASHLIESVGVTLRHQAILNATYKVESSVSNDHSCGPSDLEQKCLSDLTFYKQSDNYEESVNKFCGCLHKDFIICQINIVPTVFNTTKGEHNPELLVTRLEYGQQPLVIKTCIGDSTAVRDIVSEFHSIIQTYNVGFKLSDKVAWNNSRNDCNKRLKVLLGSMENVLLGYWKGLLMGSPAHADDASRLNKVTKKVSSKFVKLGFSNINHHVLEIFLDSLPWLNSGQVRQALAALLNIPVNDSQLTEHIEFVRREVKSLCSQTLTRQKVVLILDKELNKLPWENIPILSEIAITRMPSLYFIVSYLTRYNHPKEIDTVNTFFVLNPDNNLQRTQETFEAYFASFDWSGITKRRPTTEEWLTALENHEFFIYCGHGSGEQYADGRSIQKHTCKSAVILAGCSSARLETIHSFEPNGVAFSYLLAGSPCVFGTLWNVGDIEMDLVLTDLLKRFLMDSDKKTMAEAIIPARTACKMRSLTGANMIIYGMPILAD